MHAEKAPPRGEGVESSDPAESESALRRDWARDLGIGAAGFTTHSLAADAESLQRARSFVRDALEQWGLRSFSDEVALVAGELVSNAVCHALPASGEPAARSTAWLGLARQDSTLVCAVNDPSPEVPVLRDADESLERGRGLRIINALSSSWGWSLPTSAGKTVWARIPVALGPSSGPGAVRPGSA
ncbi:ATP-binding protein [Streptomyces sp. NBC_00887]|uniref:ATP-binding protein n=1 Tax=Streptomyces sp. NBC_00887 TaxID=2975859 RepID=UPI003864ECC6|nr:ATP-binding protein [Streptomyces sp. NBC_00887]